MNRLRFQSIHACMLVLLALTTLAPAQSVSNAQAISRLSSRFLARGEHALLEIGVSGPRPPAMPSIPESRDFEIRPTRREPQAKLLPGRKIEHVYEFLISGYSVGSRTIPSIEITMPDGTLRTEPLEFVVFDPDELQWADAVAGNQRFRYAAAFHVLNNNPHINEATPVELKVYLPHQVQVVDWGVPEFERDGISAWRFQPSMMRGSANLLGVPHLAIAYPSTLTPNRIGNIGIGPGRLRLVTGQMVLDGFMRQVTQEVFLEIPKLELKSLELPPDAPPGFVNAVGDFRIETRSSVTECTQGEPIPVEIIITGSGNLDTISPPKPTDSEGWKLYEPTQLERGAERQELSGITVFRQFLRPLDLQPQVPSFRLVYFNPDQGSYFTADSPPIPLRMKPAAVAAAPTAVAATSVPLERMTDILGLAESSVLTRSPHPSGNSWIWNLIATTAAMVLIGKALWLRYGHRRSKRPETVARIKQLRDIERLQQADESEFLLAAGRYIEQWAHPNKMPELAEVLALRDDLCFRPDRSTQSSNQLAPPKRKAIVDLLRHTLPILLCASITLFASSRVIAQEDTASRARAAYDTARYDEAAALWLGAGPYESLTADTLYNIGNACYRSGLPGDAALYYRRALLQDPSHAEARQNLRFIERKYGSISLRHSEFSLTIARIPLDTWKHLLGSGIWLCALGWLVFPATRPGARLRTIGASALVIGPCLILAGAGGWIAFPDDARFAPIERQAVVVAENTSVHADASRTSPDIIDAPPGSVCEILHSSGRWTYVMFSNQTRGWIITDTIEHLVPTTPPTAPRPRRFKADGNSA
jgi:hypothetical protein